MSYPHESFNEPQASPYSQTPRSTQLCPSCATQICATGRPALDHGRGRIVEYSKPFQQFRSAAHSGCFLCEQLWVRIDHKGGILRLAAKPSLLEFSMRVSRLVTNQGAPDPDRLWVELRSHDAAEDVGFDMTPVTEADRLRPPSSIGSSTAGPCSWSIAESWMQTCLQSHQLCAAVENTGDFFPTRLVYVGTPSSSIRLVQTAECDMDNGERYVTLSHCWGRAKTFRLLQSNEGILKSEIPLEDLPKTFRDAIEVARRLKVNYIWIDSLCIVQDSENDWAYESSLMHKIYAGGLCNIAATGAEDGSRGLFFERNWWQVQACQIFLPWMGEAGVDYAIHDRFWQHNVVNAPLNKRAWVIQERLLSRRNLHFGSQQLLWECGELRAAERYLQGMPVDPFNFPLKELDPRLVRSRLLETDDEKTRRGHWAWSEIVRQYSAAALTDPDDKLVALSGIARQFQSVLGDEYIAGMWRRSLISDLLWTTAFGPCVRPEAYRAPSFSWASLDGRAIFQHRYEEAGVIATVLDVSISLFRPCDETGKVTAGHLVLMGAMRRVQLSWDNVSPETARRRSATVTSIDGQSIPPSHRPRVDIDAADEDFFQPSYIMLLWHRENTSLEAGPFKVRGIALKHLSGTQGDYRRIGVYSNIQGEEADLLLRGDGEIVKRPCGPCHKFDGSTGHHTIRIF